MSNMILATSVSNVTDLNAAIAAADNATAPGGYEIDLAANADIEIASELDAINLRSGVTLTIAGLGATLDGENASGVSDGERGLFVYAGTVTIENLTIANATAVGGAGAGGGAGLGGGLFVADDTADGAASAGNVTLADVVFSNDSAVGGAGGVGSGGGGLGGNSANGGGGIGTSAEGGFDSFAASPAGAGIVLGAGQGGDSPGAFGHAGGLDGGGGAAGEELLYGPVGGVAGGAGGGVEGSDSDVTLDGGDGGFGGGGGDGGEYNPSHGFPISYGVGGHGGFGGGGGQGVAGGGAGGFGGGGADGASGGFGGGGDNGGGLGAGGAIFVQQGASLSIQGGAILGGSVAGGAGGPAGGAGLALGSGAFLQGDETLSLGFNQTDAETTTIADVIADQGASGGTGAGALAIGGPGLVILQAFNRFSGGTTIDSGRLQLGDDASAGSGEIAFAPSAVADLILEGGVVLNNPIADFGYDDAIEIEGFEPTSQSFGDGALNLASRQESLSLNFGASDANVGFALSENVFASETVVTLAADPDGGGRDFAVNGGDSLTLFNTQGVWSAVTGSGGAITLDHAYANVAGDDAVYLRNGSSDIAVLYGNDPEQANQVYGSGSAVILRGAAADIFGDDTVYLQGTATNGVNLYATDGQWDNVYGSGGTVTLADDTYANIFGVDEVQLYGEGASDIAVLYATNGQWDNVSGFGGTVILRDAFANISGNFTVDLEGTGGDFAVLSQTNLQGDNVYGSNGSILLRGAAANLFGSDDVVRFDGGFGDDNVTALGGGSRFAFESGIGGVDTISGFAANDTLQLSRQDFGGFQALLNSGDLSEADGNTIVTLDGSDQIIVKGATLSASQFAFS